MKYVSTRGQAPAVGFLAACLAGLAPDGGLYVPEAWPNPGRPDASDPYGDVAARILKAFAGDDLSPAEADTLCASAYRSFSHAAIAPLTQTGPAEWMLELHHGPTLAFKDIAMQLIARLYDLALSRRGQRMTVICATSGDTGGAAAAAFAGAENVDLVILHPYGRISPVQRLFMTTTGAANVRNLAVDGDFDECQAIVKALFADRAFAERVNLSGVNSINWARIVGQVVYYAAAQAALGSAQPIQFVVPTGNMGDAFAGYVAARCGLLAGLDLICAVNANRALADLFFEGRLRKTAAKPTPSPAMDISTPSNFERLLFELTCRDAASVRAFYKGYAQTGAAELGAQVFGRLGCTGLSAKSVDDAEAVEMIGTMDRETGWLICPHTAVGFAAGRSAPRDGAARVVLATAHAAKFPETVAAAVGRAVDPPARCADRLSRVEAFDRIPADLSEVAAYIEAGSRGAV